MNLLDKNRKLQIQIHNLQHKIFYKRANVITHKGHYYGINIAVVTIKERFAMCCYSNWSALEK